MAYDLYEAHNQKLKPVGLLLNQPELAILCTRCGFALTPTPDRVARHLHERHDVPKEDRSHIAPLLKSLAIPNLSTLARRPDGSKPHAHLTV